MRVSIIKYNYRNLDFELIKRSLESEGEGVRIKFPNSLPKIKGSIQGIEGIIILKSLVRYSK